MASMTNKSYGIRTGIKTGVAVLAALACFDGKEAQATSSSCYYSSGSWYGCDPSSSSYGSTVSGSAQKQGDVSTATAATASRAQGADNQGAVSNRVNSVITRAGGGVGKTTSVGALDHRNFQAGMSAGDGSADYAVWGDGSFTRMMARDTAPNGASIGRNYGMVVGGDARFNQFLVGLAGAFQTSSSNLTTLDGRSLVTSYGVTPYAAYSINQIFSVSAQFSYAHVVFHQHLFESDTTGSQRTNGNWDGDRYGGNFAINAYYPVGKINLTGTTGVSYTHESPESYTNSRSQIVRPKATNLGIYQLGGEVGYAFTDFEPYVGITMEYEFEATGIQSLRSGNVVSTSGTFDAIYKAGGRMHFNDAVLGGLEFSTVQHRDYDQSYTLSANVRVSF